MSIGEAGQLWASGRPLEAGRRLMSLIPPAERPRWAGEVLAWVYARSGIARVPEVEAVIAATRDTPSPDAVAAVGEGIAAAFRRAEATGRFDSLHEAVLGVAQQAAEVLRAGDGDAPDPRPGWWLVASVKCVGDVLDEGFGAEAWAVLAGPGGSTGEAGDALRSPAA